MTVSLHEPRVALVLGPPHGHGVRGREVDGLVRALAADGVGERSIGRFDVGDVGRSGPAMRAARTGAIGCWRTPASSPRAPGPRPTGSRRPGSARRTRCCRGGTPPCSARRPWSRSPGPLAGSRSARRTLEGRPKRPRRRPRSGPARAGSAIRPPQESAASSGWGEMKTWVIAPEDSIGGLAPGRSAGLKCASTTDWPQAGGMFALNRKRLLGSTRRLIARSRSKATGPKAAATRAADWSTSG